jgi:D-inositol-3-phosphate glycosyltransferase
MGVVQERKAQLALVIAFARIAPLFPDAMLVLVGDHPSPYAAAVRAAVDTLGLAERVKIIGIHPDTFRWYHTADVLISASDTESLPRSMMEAMAFGVPVLAADVFGVSEVIDDGRNGWLCQPTDGAALTVGMYRALSCAPENRARMSQACLDDAAAFDGGHYASAYAELMSTLVATHRAGVSASAPTGGTT